MSNNTLNHHNDNMTSLIFQYGYPYNPIPFWLFLSFETIMTIAGNAVLCWLFSSHKILRTGQNYFIISLSVSDMLAGLAVVPCEYCRWNREKSGSECPFICGSTISFIMAVTVINLVLIATDRYVAVEMPYYYVRSFTKRRGLLMISIGWLLAIFICLLPLIWEFNPNVHYHTKRMINVSYAGLLFLITIAAGIYMTVLYALVMRTRRRKVDKLAKNGIETYTNSTGVRVCIITTTLYFINWIQYCVVEILLQCNIDMSAEVMDSSYFVFMLSPCLDSILYAYYRKDFRRYLILWCKRQCSPIQKAYYWIEDHVGRSKQNPQRNEEEDQRENESLGGGETPSIDEGLRAPPVTPV